MDHELLARCRHRATPGWPRARALSVGLGIPDQRAGHGAAAARGAGPPARIQRPQRGQTGSRERGSVARRGSGRDLWPQAARTERNQRRTTAWIVLGVAVGWMFVRRQQRLTNPLIDLKLFRIGAFRGSLLMYGGSILMLFGGFLFIPQYLQLVLGLSPLVGGLWTLPWAIGFVVGSLGTPALAKRIRRSILI